MKKLTYIIIFILLTVSVMGVGWFGPDAPPPLTLGLIEQHLNVSNINRERCIINIQSSNKNIVNWDIINADANTINTHCDFDEKKIFGGEVN